MIEILLEPFAYQYMINAVFISALVGATCAFLSCFLMLKGWSLMGDALAHSVLPGVVLAYVMGLPYALGAFFAGSLAALGIFLVKLKTKLKEDAIIGLIFTTFFAAGLLFVSIRPASVDIQSIVLGNILAITPYDMLQVIIISAVCLITLQLKWRDFMIVFFDEKHAKSIGMNVSRIKIMFFTLLSAAAVAALQTVGACLVIAMVITPGATAYLLTDRFSRLIIIAVSLGSGIGALGAYTSYFLNTNAGALIVSMQSLVFAAVFFFAPKHGLLKSARPKEI